MNMRLFIAILPTEAFSRTLCDVICEMKARGVHANFTKPENLHLTLAFLGEQASAAPAAAAMSAVSCEPFELKLSGLSAFSREGGDILFASVAKTEPLLALANALAEALHAKGIVLPARQFSVHFTLAREARFGKNLSLLDFSVGKAKMQAQQIDLMCSKREKGKPTYTSIHSRLL